MNLCPFDSLIFSLNLSLLVLYEPISDKPMTLLNNLGPLLKDVKTTLLINLMVDFVQKYQQRWRLTIHIETNIALNKAANI